MSIKFNGATADQRVEFSGIDLSSLTTYSICSWIYPDGMGYNVAIDIYAGLITRIGNPDNASSLYTWDQASGVRNTIFFAATFDGDNGLWYADASSIAISNLYLVCSTYDNTSTGNDPLIYVNKVSLNVNESTTPSGNATLSAGVTIGNQPTGSRTFNGQVIVSRIYDTILTQEDVDELYDSKILRGKTDNLVFHTPLLGAKGMSTFDGVALGAGNTILDYVSGAEGVPAGSPIGRGNTIQRIY